MQQLAEGRGASAVQGRTDGHLDCFQIDATAFVPLGKKLCATGFLIRA